MRATASGSERGERRRTLRALVGALLAASLLAVSLVSLAIPGPDAEAQANGLWRRSDGARVESGIGSTAIQPQPSYGPGGGQVDFVFGPDSTGPGGTLNHAITLSEPPLLIAPNVSFDVVASIAASTSGFDSNLDPIIQVEAGIDLQRGGGWGSQGVAASANWDCTRGSECGDPDVTAQPVTMSLPEFVGFDRPVQGDTIRFLWFIAGCNDACLIEYIYTWDTTADPCDVSDDQLPPRPADPGPGMHEIGCYLFLNSGTGGFLSVDRGDLPTWARDTLATVGAVVVVVGPFDSLASGDPSVLVNLVPVSTVGSATSHGGLVVEGSARIFVNGTAAAVIGNMTVSPASRGLVREVGGPIVTTGNGDVISECVEWSWDDTCTIFAEIDFTAPATTTVLRVVGKYVPGMEPGRYVIVGDGGPNPELARIEALGSLILSQPLTYTHPAGATVALLPESAQLVLNSEFCGTGVVTINMNTNGGDGNGTGGPDVILGTPGDDVITGFGGDDIICAGDGRDRIYAGPGADTVFGGFGIDYIFGEAGEDTLDGEGGSDRMFGGPDNDLMLGDSGADRMFGGPGNDEMRGMGGQDFMWGEAGNDLMQGNFQTDNMWGGPGNDTMFGAGGKDSLFGEADNDTMSGGNNTDYLDGGPGVDTANGGRGRDKPVIAPQVRASNGQLFGGSGCIAETIVNCQPTP